MAATRKRSSAKNIFNPNVLAQLHTGLDQLLEKHGCEITASLEESDTHKLKIGLSIDVDNSESQPEIELNMSFVPRTVKDRRSIQCVDEDQSEFRVFSPAEMEAKEKEEKAREKAEAAKAKAGGNDTPED